MLDSPKVENYPETGRPYPTLNMRCRTVNGYPCQFQDPGFPNVPVFCSDTVQRIQEESSKGDQEKECPFSDSELDFEILQ
jgi:hypothetical protein